MSIKMHGPALDGSGETHETNVHEDNIAAFKKAGWVEGELPKSKPADDSAAVDETPAGLMKHTKAELVAIAEGKGITVVPDEMTKQQIVDAIEAADASGNE